MKTSSEELEKYVKKRWRFAKKKYKRMATTRNKALAYNALLVFSVVLLLLTTLYAGKHASDTYSTDSNALITTQQYGHGLKFPVTMPGPHATLIVLPIMYIQGHLPFHYSSFTIVNVGLVLITMFAWAFLMIKIFGRKYEVPILILLSSLIFTSVTFSLTLGYDTIRNIEYPIALWFVMIAGRLLKNLSYKRIEVVSATIGSLLFIVVLAGDSFFNYAILMPLLAVIALYWVQSREFSLRMIKALGLIVAVVVGAHLLKFILQTAGIINFNYAFWDKNIIIPATSLGPSLGIALQQLLQLQGGSIFSQVVDYHALATFVNFGLLIAGIVALVLILMRAGKSYRAKKGLADQDFVLAVMAISYFVVFLIYVLSGFVIAHSPTGQIISDQNTRYISLLPLISVIGLVWLLKNYYKDHRVFTALLIIVLLSGIAISRVPVRTAYNSNSQQLELTPTRTNVNNLISILKTNHVSTVLSDYWYGPVIAFWSNSTINIAAQEGCSLPLPSSSFAEYHYTHQKGMKAALIIDRGGLNYGYWTCTNAQIAHIYGTPSKKVQISGAALDTTVNIWIY